MTTQTQTRPQIKLVAHHLRDNRYAVQPEHGLGTMGWSPVPWTVCFIRARSADDALRKAKLRINEIIHSNNYDLL